MRSTLCSLLMCLCTLPLFAQGDTLTFTFSDQGYDRSYIVYVPEAYDGTEEWPLVFNFHGYSINGSVQMLWTGMNVVADTAHFLLVYPNGLLMRNTNPALAPQGPGWNAGSDSDTVFFSTQPVHEPTFVSNLIDQVAANFNVDLRRVYTTGWSNGGMQSTVLACELSDRIAASAPVGAAGDEGRPCNPERIMPILYTHGTADPLVHYEDGGANPNFWGIPDYLAFWADMKGCNAIPDTVMVPDTDTTDSSTVEIITWNDCSSPLIHHRIVGGGHTWSGGPPLLPDFVGPINQDINTGVEVWKFFKQFEHPNPRSAQVIADTMISGDSTRTYLLYVPAGYDGSEDWPLVINYHGFTNSSEFQMALSDMNAVADTGQFLVVYPQGLLVENPFNGQTAPGWNIFGTLSDNDDVAFTSQLIDQIAADYAVDLTRVYATGWSMGANMSYDLACQLDDRIAAIAPVANQMSEMQISTCTADRPMPTLQMHGTADPIVPYQGAVFPSGMDSFLVATRTAMYWAEMNGCSPTADTTTFADLDTSDQSTVTVYAYGDCDAGADVLFYEITGGGHTWSGGAPLPEFLGPVNRDIHASSEIWKFFNRQTHPSPRVPQLFADTLISGDSTRTYLLYVPAGYDGSEDWPLILDYHGFTGTSEDQVYVGQWEAIADTAHFLVAFPQGLSVFDPLDEIDGLGWNITGGLADHDDIAFTSDLIDRINDQFRVDSDRIFASGLSMGGEMALALACGLSDRIAAVASVSSPMTTALMNACSPDRQVPVLQMHGTEDPIIPMEGITVYPPAIETAQFWAQSNGCAASPDSTALENTNPDDNSDILLLTYPDCANDTEVLFYQINGGGHQWPGGGPLPPSFVGNQNLDIHASSEIWNFFNRNPLPDPLVDTREIRSADVHWQVYPNPFRNQIQVGLSLTQKAEVSVSLYNLQGQPLWQTMPQRLSAGDHHLAYELAQQLPEGMYVMQLRINETVSSRLVMHNQ
jgi:polyhydroxybutyrate depolymerase